MKIDIFSGDLEDLVYLKIKFVDIESAKNTMVTKRHEKSISHAFSFIFLLKSFILHIPPNDTNIIAY